MDTWKNRMLEIRAKSTKKRIINFIAFLIIWLIMYYLINFNFWILAFILSYMFVYFRTDNEISNGIIFLADEFDRHHNALADNVRELYDRLETLENENEDFRQEISDLSEKISNLEAPKNKGFDPFYDFIDEIENEEKKAP
ncbi:hypothetical protein I9189_015775 [Acinetobacter bereziniae]|uniref:hypothetical protein n=1 Tax=Acinetobacter bereziniae TaxID=106648 RepID=UPI0019054006|nr:hypothetical protein [Acinetobacter bereziniae]QQC79444.1 hypothetical protein I9192_15910 [Acinetobacter bereziniae]UUN92521.1 hypothetical protein I9189_015775 [Acinetobacter bereziniae]